MKRPTNDTTNISIDKGILANIPYSASVRRKLLEKYNECLDLEEVKLWFREQLKLHSDWKLKELVEKEQKQNEIGIQN